MTPCTVPLCLDLEGTLTPVNSLGIIVLIFI